MRRPILALLALSASLCLSGCNESEKPCLVHVYVHHEVRPIAADDLIAILKGDYTPKEEDVWYEQEQASTKNLVDALDAIAGEQNIHIQYHPHNLIKDPEAHVHVHIEVSSLDSLRRIYYLFNKSAIETYKSGDAFDPVKKASGEKDRAFPTVGDVMKAVRRWRQAHNE